MKNAVITFGFAVVIILGVIIHSSITAKDVTSNETEHSLDLVIEDALNEILIDEYYTDKEVEAFIGDLGNNIQKRLSSESKLAIEMQENNWEEGQLTLKFIETYRLPNGNKTKTQCVKTIQAEHYNPAFEY